MRNTFGWLVFGILLLSLTGCSGDDEDCTPGATQVCHCAGGTQGVQTCTADGKSWGTCNGCAATPDGGAEAGPDAAWDASTSDQGETDGTIPDKGPCAAGQTLCDKQCVNLDNSPSNCGQCGNACNKGEACSAGKCVVACQPGLTNCSGKCVNLQSDNGNCGTCAATCKAGFSCTSGMCGISCQAGLTNCYGKCVDLQADLYNCGMCGTTCTAGQVCSTGKCALSCQPGLTNCSGTCVNIKTNNGNCGKCASKCTAGHVCSSGQCALTCQSGLTDCYGTCVNLEINGANCGKCANKCKPGYICTSGKCVLTCQVGLTNCFGTCSNLLSDSYNCGNCGNQCKPGETCSNGKCTLVCQTGMTTCTGKCVDLKTDAKNCGKCGILCSFGEVCSSGKCTASCGNGIIDAGELCDGKVLGGKTCKSLGHHGGTLACGSACMFDVSACYRCGDGVVNGSEQCDGAALGGKTCKSLTYDGGTLTCTTGCKYVTTACFKCTDKKKNGDETDVDCGGTTCSACALGMGCKTTKDCKLGLCMQGTCRYAQTCKELNTAQSGLKDGAYTIDPNGGSAGDAFSVYCDMTTGGGGWTLIAKVLGNNKTMNRINTAQWRQRTKIGNTASLKDENALGAGYDTVTFTDVMIRSLSSSTKNLAWRHPSTYKSAWAIVDAGKRVSDGKKLFGGIKNLHFNGTGSYHNDCSEAKYGWLTADWSYNTTPGIAGHKSLVHGHAGGVVGASLFDPGAKLTHTYGTHDGKRTRCVTDFALGGGYSDAKANSDDSYAINAHWWGAGNTYTHSWKSHGLFVR